MDFKRRLLIAVIFSLPLILVINFLPYPKSFEEASIFQILALFFSLLLASTFLFNIFLNYLPRSFIAALGVVLLSVLQALNLLSYLSGAIILVAVIISIKFFPKMKLVKSTKIPKLTKLDKQKKR